MAQQLVFWKKRILMPLWILRIILMVFIIIVYTLTLRYINEYRDMIKPTVGSVIVFLLFLFIVLLIDILAIVLFLRDTLRPGLFLLMNAFQTTFWAIILIMDFVAVGRGASAGGIGFSIFVFLTFGCLLVYSFLGYKHAKKHVQQGQYVPAHNPTAPIPASADHSASSYQHSTSSTLPANAPIELKSQCSASYYPTAAGDYHQQFGKHALDV